jgi:hypothetical protein
METPQDAPKKRKKIAAEKIFDWAVYGGISYFAQALSGTLATRWLKYGGGRKYGAMAAEWTGRNIMEQITSKRGAAAVEEANTFVTVTALVTMGNMFVTPVKLIEDHKAQAVQWIEDNVVHPDKSQLSEEQKQEIATAIHAVENRQKQTWFSLLTSRGGALATVYMTERALGQRRNKVMQDLCGDAVTNTFRSAGMRDLANNPATRQFAEIGFVDFFYSTIAAGGLYLYSKLIRPDEKTADDNPVFPALEHMVAEEEPLASERAGGYAARVARTMPKGAFTDYAAKQGGPEAVAAL